MKRDERTKRVKSRTRGYTSGTSAEQAERVDLNARVAEGGEWDVKGATELWGCHQRGRFGPSIFGSDQR